MPIAERKPRDSRERGSAIIEFALCFSFFWLPLFIGLLIMGFNLIRAVQVTQVCRDAGHMYSTGIDFSQSGGPAQRLLVSLAPGLNITPTGGNGVVILSTITYVDGTLCATGGYGAGNCPNFNQMVFTRRIVVGNNSGTPYVSAFGSPSASIMDPSGNGDVLPGSRTGNNPGYLNDSSAIATGFSSVITFNSSSQTAYLAEMVVTSPDFSFGGFFGIPQISALSVF